MLNLNTKYLIFQRTLSNSNFKSDALSIYFNSKIKGCLRLILLNKESLEHRLENHLRNLKKNDGL